MSVVGTNVLVLAANKAAPDRARAFSALVPLRAQSRVRVTRQILREYTAVVTRPQSWSAALTPAEAVADVDVLIQRFDVLDDGPDVWRAPMGLTRRFAFGRKQVQGANIVTAMLAHGKAWLLTFNGADFRRFAPVIEAMAP